MATRLEHFFDRATRKIDFVSNVTGRVGTSPLPPIRKRLAVSRSRIGDLPVSVDGSIGAGVRILALGEPVPIFEWEASESAAGAPSLPGSAPTPELAVPPGDRAFAELDLSIGAGASTALRAPVGQALSLAANAAASGEQRYRLLRSVRGSVLKVNAIGRLLERARPPQLVDLRSIDNGELHTFDARFQLGFGLKAEAGQEFDVSEVVDIFDELSLAIQAHAEATVSASLGWSLYERMQLAVGRVNVESSEPDWVRVRMQRLHRRGLTLGAKLAVQARYNAGRETFEALLDRILELDPVERLFGALQEIEALGIHEAETPEQWEAIRSRISADLADLIVDYVDPGALIDELPWEVVEPFVADIAELVAAYRGLDEKVRSFVASALGRLDLGPGSPAREALETIAALDPDDLDEVLRQVAGPDFAPVIDLLELLSGSSIEEIVLDSRAAEFISEAKALATKILDVLDGLGAQAVARLEAFTRNAGVDGVIAWLEENATTTVKLRNALEKKAGAKIRSLVERLTGKVWNRLDNDDLAGLRRFADALVGLRAGKERIERRLRGAIEALQGEVGFSMGIEISRLTERAAVLDLEMDPERRKVRKAVEDALATLSAKELLERLPEPDEDDDVEEIGYRLRDSVFSYRRIRSTSLSSFFTLLGVDRTRRTIRVDEDVVRLRQHNGDTSRHALYSTGTIRRLENRGKRAYAGNHELAVWLTSRLSGPGLDLEAPYSGVAAQELRVVYSRKDDKTLPGEIDALGDLLTDLGFLDAHRSLPIARAEDDPLLTEFSLSINFGADAPKTLLADKVEAKWNADYLNAGHRWLDERLVPRRAGSVGRPKPYTGQLLARVLEHPRFQENWTRGLDLYRVIGDDPLKITIAGRDYRVSLVTDADTGRYTQLTRLLMDRSSSFDKLEQSVGTHKRAHRDRLPEQWRRFGKRFATLLARTPFGSGWPSPLYDLWLVLARIARQDASTLDAARGLATLRFRRDVEEDWETPVRWELTGANSGSNIFPF